MEPLDVAALGVVFFSFIGVLLLHIYRNLSTAIDTVSADDEILGSMDVNIMTDHDEQDSLLPKFAGLLLSPWHSVTTEKKKETKMMQSAEKKRCAILLTMPLRIGKKMEKNPAEVPMKKVHVPYFFPLLDETAEWWKMHQFTTEEMQTLELGAMELLQLEQSPQFVAAT
ncbi:unnamed protein product [Peronospora belbahrii]|uniref:Uncharacterized protein n=1 Tax=Peronospora belbahrii TaxID=622444 RepID=A0AAU9L591_9STRA|nr:unnamed protein product [Peronospora belbahrii]